MKKNRFVSRLWKKIPIEINNMKMNNRINEIYVPYSFEEWNMKHIDSKKVYILNLLLDVLSFKKVNDINRISIGWMNLSTISNSSILIFNDAAEVDEFFKGKTENYEIDKDGFYFYLEPICYDDLPNNIKKIVNLSNMAKSKHNIEYYMGISNNVKIKECSMEEYYAVLK
ncbi:hypothetical protein [Peptostreptococcus sp. D1]|uniref:hypothetical protein n=1 Tax=Peptostreptococcus sp. D1 TaxID=72304 RepID=UPI00116057B7|nr:hypothetical protein [Peptostreptococcus sp. D1]